MKPTREQILNEPDGRQMDEWVAEFVLEFEPIELVMDLPCPYCTEEMYLTSNRAWCTNCHEWRYSPYKEYSEDIAAAWEVVEKMRERGFSCSIETDFTASDKWHCTFDGLEGYGYEEGTTVCLAICRAALLAVLEGYKE